MTGIHPDLQEAKTFSQPNLIPVGENTFRLAADYHYQWLYGTWRRLTIKAGFETDIASTPRLLWGLGFPPDGLHRAASVVHDALYRARGFLPRPYAVYEVWSGRTWCEGHWEAVPKIRFNREDADRLFGRLLREAGVPKWRRRAMYRAVRAVAWLFWQTQKVR